MEYTPVKDLNNHRSCDVSEDGKVVAIQLKGCKTIITANPDGTLNFTFEMSAA